VRKILQVMAWLLILAITVLSLVPPGIRPVTPAPHNLEHLAIFVATGLAFGLAYPKRHLTQLIALLAFTASIEIAQFWVPGRHARLSDFIVNAVGVGLGAGLALILSWRYTAPTTGRGAAN
jgi:VanZ family protein